MKAAQVPVTLASNSDEALHLATTGQPDIIIMDHRTPPMGGIRLCRKLRALEGLADTRIVILGDSEDQTSQQASMDAGADAYWSRMLDPTSLLEAAFDLPRHAGVAPAPPVLKAGSIEMVPDQWTISVDHKPVHLTAIEYRLLQELLQVKGRVLTREALMERVWGHAKSAKLETRTLDVHMSRLRHKLRSAAESIITVRNVGYRIEVFPDWLGQ